MVSFWLVNLLFPAPEGAAGTEATNNSQQLRHGRFQVLVSSGALSLPLQTAIVLKCFVFAFALFLRFLKTQKQQCQPIIIHHYSPNSRDQPNRANHETSEPHEPKPYMNRTGSRRIVKAETEPKQHFHVSLDMFIYQQSQRGALKNFKNHDF